MKRTNIYLRLVVACLLIWTGVEDVCGQLASSGTWNTTTVATHTVTLNGNVNINGTITIPQGVTLTIHAGSYTLNTYTGTVTTTDDCSNRISFNVFGTLIITGASTETPTIINGGNSGEVGNINGGGENAVSLGNGFTKAGRVILVNGKGQVKLQNVKAQNLFAGKGPKTSYAAFIQAAHHANNASTKDNRAKIDLTDVTVTNCLNANDFGIIGASDADCNSTFTLTRTNINHCMVKANDTGTAYGGVIKGSGSSDCNLIMENCSMSYCWGSGWGGAILWAAGKNGCKASIKNSTFSNNYARYLGGALSTEAVLELEGCTIENNIAGYGGGGIAAFPFTLSSLDNSTDQQAVGLKLLTGNTIKGNKTLYITNKGKTPPTDGGTVVSITQEVDHGFNPRYSILNATDVYYPSGGGGLWVLMNKDGWNCELVIGEGNTISGNTSAYNGGGVFLYKQRPYTTASGNVTFLDDYTSGTGKTSMTIKAIIEKNITAKSGGGAAIGCDVELSSFPSVTVTGGIISENTAKDGNGGGIYMPGGAFTIEGGSISNNKAKVAEGSIASSLSGNGGGIAITNGTFTILDENFTISDNVADHYGGGLYVSNNNSTSIAFKGGNFKKNSAYAGGGACVDGPVTLAVEGSNFEENTAKVGGGICLTGGISSDNKATMTYKSGRISKNVAIADNNGDTGSTGGKPAKFTTAYLQDLSKGLEGIGGGVFLDSNSELDFGGTSLGLFRNWAYNGADDIFANGDNTSVKLPNVTDDINTPDVNEGMILEGFPVESKFLYWVKDYITDDTEYSNAPKMNDENAYTGNAGVKRYRYALSSMSADDLYWKLSPNTYTGYVSVALGYEVIYATINKYGLEQGKKENAIFTLTQKGQTTPYIRMVVSADNSKETTENGETYISKRVALPAGIWTIAETSWSWAYDLTLPDVIESSTLPEGVEEPIVGENYYTRELTQASTKANSKMPVFNFKNKEKEGTTELRMENIKVNKMKASTSGN